MPFPPAFSPPSVSCSLWEPDRRSPPSRQPPCLAYDQAAAHLSKQYAERPVGVGLKTDGNVLQIFASRKTGTWTLLSIRPDGTSCVIAAGQHWQEIIDPQDLV